MKKDIADNINNITPETIWMVQGWNINENFDEIDIVESSCFLIKEHAQEELQRMQNRYQRIEWVLDYSIIGNLGWREGFVRIVNGQPVSTIKT